MRGPGQSWLAVGEEWLKEREESEDRHTSLQPATMLTIATCS